MSESNGRTFSKSNILTVGGVAIMLGGLIATVSITLSFATSQAALREDIRDVKDEIGKNVQATKDEQRAAVQAVKDEVRDRTAELASRIGDIKQKMEIADLKLVDRWTGNDMRHLWSEFVRSWIEVKRRNPALDWPDLPEVK